MLKAAHKSGPWSLAVLASRHIMSATYKRWIAALPGGVADVAHVVLPNPRCKSGHLNLSVCAFHLV